MKAAVVAAVAGLPLVEQLEPEAAEASAAVEEAAGPEAASRPLPVAQLVPTAAGTIACETKTLNMTICPVQHVGNLMSIIHI